ncbi:YpdA family putative bacillithiol disulfide reductase [Niallia oryzisoli]|uniref:YpdA family putative bacillithiol disulfide reductase n=1 Tax=Niallia oryzisoli TaxID=1737571 RepID=A0ABZ2CQ07_9BACI
MIYDVIVIGGGPCGLATGLALQEQGLTYVVLEKGGIVNSIVKSPLNVRFYSTSDRLEIGGVPFLSKDERPTRHELMKYYQSVVSRQSLEIKCYHKVTKIIKEPECFTLNTINQQGRSIHYQAKMLVIATGIFDNPKPLNIEGEDLPKVIHYYHEGHQFYGQRVLVVGGKNSAIETAIDLYRNGAEVTLVHRGESAYHGIKPTLLMDIRNFIEKGKIQFFPQSKVLRIAEDSVLLGTPKETVSIENDFVFPLIGYQPDSKMLKSIGIQMDESSLVPMFDKETYETNIENIFLAGVVTGGTTNKVYIEDGRFHGAKIAEVIKKRFRRMEISNNQQLKKES